MSEVGRGLCVLVGITTDDTEEDMNYIAKKILSLRLFEDENGKMWKKSTQDLALEVLCVSQFTLYAKCGKKKPDFHMAMPGSQSKDFYNTFLHKLRADYQEDKIKGRKQSYQSLSNLPKSCIHSGQLRLTTCGISAMYTLVVK